MKGKKNKISNYSGKLRWTFYLNYSIQKGYFPDQFIHFCHVTILYPFNQQLTIFILFQIERHVPWTYLILLKILLRQSLPLYPDWPRTNYLTQTVLKLKQNSNFSLTGNMLLLDLKKKLCLNENIYQKISPN